MKEQPIYIGKQALAQPQKSVSGEFVVRNGIRHYRIHHTDQMRPFFMSIVSAYDHWLFISSNGALTAGRKNAQHALFPYYTDDKIHDSPELTGSKTILLVEIDGKRQLWEPFSDRYQWAYSLERNLYKSVYGNSLTFEEHNADLGLTFSYTWQTSDRFGFVKHAQLINATDQPIRVAMLDGIQNIMPYGVSQAMQTELSTLIDAYKKNELEAESGLGIYILSSILVDKPEPSEALKATTVWAVGLKGPRHLISSLQLDDFRAGKEVRQETDIRAERGAYFLQADLDLPPGKKQEWFIVAEVDQGPSDVVASKQRLQNKPDLRKQLLADIAAGTEQLRQIVARADGLQLTDDRLSITRHYANVLFNLMRGGIFDNQYAISKADLMDFVRSFNQPVFEAQQAFLQALPDEIALPELLKTAAQQKDPQLLRLCYEYLPITFSRRHGDPSRPWNSFSIDTRREDGTKILNFQGNWRDIFQNWEALCLSYPEFTESIISKFVNASTVDGYNPYRITRAGFDWEVIDPHDPWSFIGYWGDHQIIYLLKLMEISRSAHPGELETFLTQELFSYAHVPYRIKSYDELLADPKDTIVYDHALAEKIYAQAAARGADGKLILTAKQQPLLVNLAEKILVAVLAKLSNFIPGAGIWMNTQRPEWNDANNALVGYGVSMVTLCYLRRFQVFFEELLTGWDKPSVMISQEVADWLAAINRTLKSHEEQLKTGIFDTDRKTILDGLGKAGSEYRASIYASGFSGRQQEIDRQDLIAFIRRSLAYIDHTIEENERPDKLYHAYNLMELQPGGDSISIRYLDEMLEGQVAVLSSGYLSPKEALKVLHALKNSALYREDQYSYLLYPDRQLARYTEKNQIPSESLHSSRLLQALVATGDRTLVEQDINGGFHFNGAFRNAADVTAALQKLSGSGHETLVREESALVLRIFEQLFDHQSFTGRSGTFYGYEGLGSIYWHMVSKLLLAVGEIVHQARRKGEDEATCGQLIECYYDIRAGIGLNKSPEVYGAFPTDPYSHTPGNAGAQQPGMTGQVKEDILARWLELGIGIQRGEVVFHPALLRSMEFLKQPAEFDYVDLQGEPRKMKIAAGSLAFTFCQVPVVYQQSEESYLAVTLRNGETIRLPGLELGRTYSQLMFRRAGEIQRLTVHLQGL
jgi:hypothetical protein